MTSTIHADKIMNSSGDQDSGVDLLVNDQVKIKTANTDRITVTDSAASMGDNFKLRLGASNDLNLYHDGSNSYIEETGTGDTHIVSNTVRIRADQINLSNNANNLDGLTMDSAGRLRMYKQPLTFVRYSANTEHGAYGAGSSRNNVICKPTNVQINQGGNYAANSGTFTCPVAGIYRVSFGGNHYGNAVSNYLFCFVRKNGTAVDTVYTKVLTTDWQQLTRTTYVSCAANDTLTITNENDGTSGGGSKGGWDITTYSYFSFSLVM